jgi:thiol:disulfide interchange protein DsbC
MTSYRLFAAFLLTFCATQLAAAADDALIAKLTARIRNVLPDAKVTSIKPAPLPGLYEVSIGPTILYMTGDGKFAVRGDIFDLDAKSNVTDQRRMQARVESLKGLGESSPIRFPATGGKTRHEIYVFTDIDCGYCRKMHKEISQLNAAGVTVNYLAFPRTGLDSESYDKAVAVWCAPDRQSALTEAKTGKKIQHAKCDNPVAEHFRLGEAMGVQGTPAVYSADGEELGGYIPAQELVRILNGGG